MAAITTRNVTATGGWDAVAFDRKVNSLAIRNRAAAELQVSSDGGTTYFTIPSGSSLAIGGFNLGAWTLHVKATGGNVVEIVEQSRA